MKRIVLLAIILSVCMSGCKIHTNNSDEILNPRSDVSMVPSLAPTISLSPKHSSINSPYLAYYKKYKELAGKYGKAAVVEIGNGDYSEHSYLNGVCVVDLMDFNGDGIKDLFVIYSNGRLTGKNLYNNTIPQAGTYEIEIWTYSDGTLRQLLHIPHVCFSTFSDDEDNCFATVYENTAGRPVIQLYSEGNKNFSYTNLYYSGETIVRDKLSYDGKQFTMNGKITTEEVWKHNICEYNKILLNVYLSYPLIGMDYKNTLNQTRHVIDSLSKGKSLEFVGVEKNYISIYLKELERFNRIRPYFDFSLKPEYGLYDIDQNGTPELIVLTGTCDADYKFNIYTLVDDKLIHCGEIPETWFGLFINGAGGLINYRAHQCWYSIKKITLIKDKLKIKKVAEGVISENEDYPDLEEYGLRNYKSMMLFDVTTSYMLYSYYVKE